MNEFAVYCEPMHRVGRASTVIADDIPRALAWFKEKTGQEAKKICLHPSLSQLKVPEGITVEYVGGCLAWQIWLSAEVVSPATILPVLMPPSPVRTPVTSPKDKNTKKKVVTAPSPKVHTRNPPLLQASIEKVREQLVTSGKKPTTRNISEQLKLEGIKISHMTVARILKKNK